ncbi:MAG: T9SS C-terminal target domain-containing protein [Bacteroidetes bacterium]|nr:MAG: T9SS C-terminal target domain-containing protein [Bacteroidota bacterium]
MIRWTFLLILQLASTLFVHGQYPPPAGQPGTTAMYKDSSAFREWASKCTLEAGYINLVDTTVVFMGSNKAAYGFPEDATGPPDNFVVSLGDQGIATLTLPAPMFDSAGPDFAVFENPFSDAFLELGFVEVSSNGIDFVRFPSVSLTPEAPQVSTFDTLDATKIHNLAGKYRVFYGTPFDLADLNDSLTVDISAITHIRIIDVGGCIQPGYQSFDSQGHIINDPWPTPFHTCGMDLDAVGIIHTPIQAIQPIRVYPNPAHHMLHIEHAVHSSIRLTIIDPLGKKHYPERFVNQKDELDISDLSSGFYIARFALPDGSVVIRKFIKQ